MVLEFFVQPATLFTQGLTHSRSRTGAGLAVALGQLLLKHREHGLHSGLRLGALGRVNARLHRCRCRRDARAGGTQLVGPGRHRRQVEGRVARCLDGMFQRSIKGLPHRRELLATGLQHGREACIHAGPVGVAGERLGVGLQALQIGRQGVALALGLFPGFGRQHLDALRHHHAGFTLNLSTVLQVFNALDALSQLDFQRGQGLARQGRPSLGSVALPGHGVGKVDTRSIAQGFTFVGPFLGQGVLGLCTSQFVELFAQGLGCPLVAGAHFAKHLLHGLHCGVCGQPLTQAGGALTGSGRRKGAAGQCIKCLGIVLRGGRGHVNGLKG